MKIDKKYLNIIAFATTIIITLSGCGSDNTTTTSDNELQKEITDLPVADTNNSSPEINTTKPSENNNSSETNATTPNENNNSSESQKELTLSYELQSYYADAIGKKGTSLKSALHTILKDSAIFLTYSEDYQLLAKIDKDFSKPSEDNVILFYLQKSVPADSRCHSSNANCWNREHMWPKSLGVGYDQLVNSYTDLHHLRPSDSGINSFRSNKPYGEATTPYNKIDGFYADSKFEVSDALKGNVARAILYMAVRYEGDNNEPDLEIYANDFSDKYPAELCTMLKWNHIDPVTPADIQRNDRVQNYQGNRNPFVDNAAWVDDIWGASCNIDKNSTTQTTTDTNSSQEPLPVETNSSLETNSSITAANLYFSEYIEGSHSNKAVEIYNGSDKSIALEGYKIAIYSNGSANATIVRKIKAVTLEANKTFVISETQASDTLKGYADQILDTYLGFNGNDAVALIDPNGYLVDVIGKIGKDPGSAWGTDNTTTKEHTLRRKSSVTTGNTDGSNAFEPSVEWEGFAQDTFDGLGTR